MEETFYVLVHYRPRDPDCATFDQYILVSSGSTFADIFNDAVDNLYDYQTANYKPPRQGFNVCDPTTYDIVIGPAFGETR